MQNFVSQRLKFLFELLAFFAEVLSLPTEPVCLALEFVDSLVSAQDKVVLVSFLAKLVKILIYFFHVSLVCDQEVLFVKRDSLKSFALVGLELSI